MGAVPANNAILLATDLTAVEAHLAQLRPIVGRYGATELGAAGGAFLLSFPCSTEGLTSAVACARKLHGTLAGSATLATALHLGEASGDGLETIVSVRGVTPPGAIYLTKPTLGLLSDALKRSTEPVAQEPLAEADINVGVVRLAAAVEVAGTLSGFTRNSTRATIGITPTANSNHHQKSNDSVSIPAWKRALSYLGHSTSSILLKFVVLGLVVAMVFTFFKAKRQFLNAKYDMVKSVAETSVSPPQTALPASPPSGPLPAALKEAVRIAGGALAPNGAPAPAGAAAAATTQVSTGAAPAAPTSVAAAMAPAQGAPAAPATAAAAASTLAPASGAAQSAAPGGAAMVDPSPEAPAPAIEEKLLESCSKDSHFCVEAAQGFVKAGANITAAKFYEKGCGLDSPVACLELAKLTRSGVLPEKVDAKITSLFRRACELKDGEGCFELGYAYLRAVGIPRSAARSSEAFERGCNLDNGEACLVLGLGAQGPPEGAQRTPASANNFLSKGCQLLHIESCAKP